MYSSKSYSLYTARRISLRSLFINKGLTQSPIMPSSLEEEAEEEDSDAEDYCI